MATNTQYRYHCRRAHAAATYIASARPVTVKVDILEPVEGEDAGSTKLVKVGEKVVIYTLSRRRLHEMWPHRVRQHNTRPASRKARK